MSNPERPVNPELCMSPALQKTAEDIAAQLAGPNPLLRLELNGPTGELPDAVSSVTDPHSIYPEKREAAMHAYDHALRQLEPFAEEPHQPTEKYNARDPHIAGRLITELSLRRGLLESPSHLIPVPDETNASPPFRTLLDESGNGRYGFNHPSVLDDMQSRLTAFPDWVDMAIDNMKEGINLKHPYTASRFVMGRTVERLKKCLWGQFRLDTVFMEPIIGPIMTQETTELLGRWPRPKLRATPEERDKHFLLVTQTVVPAYHKLYEFMKNDYLPKCRDDSQLGMSHLPEGDRQYGKLLDYYAYKYNTDPQDISELLKEEWHKAADALQAVKDQMDEYRDMPVGEFCKWLMEPKDYRFGNLAEVAATYSGYQDLVGQNLGRIFNEVPRSGFEINLDLTFAGAPSYSMPGNDGTPGKFNLPLGKLANHSKLRALALYFHEGPPGHHINLAMLKEMDRRTMPSILRNCTPVLTFIEGYARYAEGFAKDLGIRESQLEVARRIASCLNVIRVAILDVGINAGGWDMATALAKYDEMYADRPAGDISRAVSWAGQSLTYPLGHRWFTDWRAQVEAAFGDKFDLAVLRDFHDVLLGDGPMAQPLMQQRVDDWLASRL